MKLHQMCLVGVSSKDLYFAYLAVVQFMIQPVHSHVVGGLERLGAQITNLSTISVRRPMVEGYVVGHGLFAFVSGHTYVSAKGAREVFIARVHKLHVPSLLSRVVEGQVAVADLAFKLAC